MASASSLFSMETVAEIGVLIYKSQSDWLLSSWGKNIFLYPSYIITLIIRLEQPCLEYFAKKEHERNQLNLTAPLDDIFTKIIGSCKTIEEKEKIQGLKNKIRDMILSNFDKMVQTHKNDNNHE